MAGPQAVEVYKMFVFATADDKDKFDVVVAKFDEHCSPKKNETFERYVFRSRIQQPTESFDTFLMDLKLKASICNFGQLQESMIRDKIMFGIKDKKLRERLLREADLTLDGAVKICHASELALQHAKTFSGLARDADAEGTAVAAVTTRHKYIKAQNKGSKETFLCKRCGTKHARQKCPAYGKICNKCKGQNHFAKQCFTKSKQNQKDKVHTVEETALSDTFFVGMVTQQDTPMEQATVRTVEQDKWTETLPVNGALVTFKLDTGAKANLINELDVKAMKVKPHINQNNKSLQAYNGQPINTKGKCRLKVQVKGKSHNLMFIIVPDGHESLLGDKACEKLGLVRRVYSINRSEPKSVNTIVNQYPDIFKGFGVLPFTYKIQLKEGAQPVVHAPRRVPAALKDKLKEELDRMESLEVIRKVEEPTEWVNSMVCINKPTGALQVCMDPKDPT